VKQALAQVEQDKTTLDQLIYAIDSSNRLVREKKVLVGQLLDVCIDTRVAEPSGEPPAPPGPGESDSRPPSPSPAG
jgi:hypothetical protein